MFSLKIIDHVRLEAERVAQNYTVHAAAAERIVRAVTVFRIGLVVLLTVAASAQIADVIFPHSMSPAIAIGAGMLALAGFAVYGALGLEASLFAHRTFAHRLWVVAERYESLLSEVNDGLIDGPTLMRRRDELTAEVDAIYQFAFGVNHAAHERLRLSAMRSSEAA
ncbi:MAG TPA: SLATT domain-containing protein [Vicinamibacterales bacterium]|nr:SLATT domain-containing protein [Vicinamibacterales bacterium]